MMLQLITSSVLGSGLRKAGFAGIVLSRSAIHYSSFQSQRFQPKLQFQRISAIAKDGNAGARSSAAKMVKAKTFKVYKAGGPEVLQWEDVEVGEPGDGQVRIRQTAVGLNFIDIYFREGIYAAPSSPFTPGMEAVGVVTAVGPGLTGRQVGDRVAYAGVIGAYAEERVIAADKVVPIPSNIDDVTAAAALLKGGTAQFLLRRLWKVENGTKILVHAAAGGVGSLLCQWGNALGATVIGVVSTEAKAAQAKEDGAHHVIIQPGDFAEKVKEMTNGEGVDIVYDSVGKDTFQQSLECLKRRGLMVLFGQSSGAPDPVPVGALAKKSLFLTRPSLMDYTVTRDERLENAGEVFSALAAGIIKVRVNQTYPLSQAAKAQKDLEERKTTGSTVLIVDSAEKL
ncbi:hypothetical protein R1sor_002868 [Riccia sorocarpa]|uniref:Probable quinone oxidoreductase n=1 Tax=Riccia sorocarpa TaxID=122646 RepID=A0ABD3H1N9_9MARC